MAGFETDSAFVPTFVAASLVAQKTIFGSKVS